MCLHLDAANDSILNILMYELFNNTLNGDWLEVTDWVWKKIIYTSVIKNIYFLRVLKIINCWTHHLAPDH